MTLPPAPPSSAAPPPNAADAGLPWHIMVRVYWEDTDAGGVVFYANYLKFFERARTEWLRAAGIAQQAMRDATGVVFVAARSDVRYLRPARLDDWLRITVLPQSVQRASMVLQQQAWRGNELLCEGVIRIGCVQADAWRPARIPDGVLQALAAPRPVSP